MNITIDKRKTDILYIDKENNHVFDNEEVIKLVATNNTSNINTYIKMLAGTYNLNDTEIAVLEYLMTNDNNQLAGAVCIGIAKLIHKSTATIARAIASLRNKRLIYGNESNAIKVTSSIVTSISNITNAKFLIIELHPEVTSNGISL